MTDKIISLAPGFNGRDGISGFFTWKRLEGILRDAGELRPGETIEGYRVNSAGVNFFINRVDKLNT